ncbi:MAG: YncE family protein [Bacteroidia bacterium]|nr:YncE family protein [Bacteroidia bacterium]
MKRMSVWVLCGVLMGLLATACRGDYPLIPADVIDVGDYPAGLKSVKGLYLLNEGNMGSNKCTLDFLDYTTGQYHRNIYPERNPHIVKELGDVGNDLQIYGSKLYAVINCSHYVEVMDVENAQHVGKVDVVNCRYIVFNKGKAYVSSYAGPVQLDPNARPGKVVEIDTVDLSIKREVVVGYQPEEMVIKGDRLYVANSGGYRFPNYDRTVSVIDLKTFKVINTIDVAINLHRMAMDRYGRIYVSSRGDYYGVHSDVFVLDSKTEQVTGRLGVGASEFCMSGDSLYMFGVEWSYVTSSNKITYAIYDTKKQQIVSHSFITDGTDKQIAIPYGLAVNPVTKEFFVADAKTYVNPGTLFCFSPDGRKRWSVRTGDIPAQFAFTDRTFK